MLSDRVDPSFEQRREALAKVARCTCFIGAKNSTHDDDFASGTAFFVGPTTLLTAGHVAPHKLTSIVAQIPGVRTAVVDVSTLFNKDPPVKTFPCSVVLEEQDSFVDLAILDCSQSTFRATEWLELDRTVLKHAIKVDLVGYPAFYSPQYIRDTQDIGALDKSAVQSAVREIEELLPYCELTVTHGPIKRAGKMPTYRVSTIGGMSGSPVISEGKVVGMDWYAVTYLIGVVGVHIGCNKGGNNRCVAFANNSAWKLLTDNAVVRMFPLKLLLTRSCN